MVQGRWTQHPVVTPNCPVCGQELPPVAIDIETRSDDGRVLHVELTAQPLDDAWWDAVAEAHPTCGTNVARQRYQAGLS